MHISMHSKGDAWLGAVMYTDRGRLFEPPSDYLNSLAKESGISAVSLRSYGLYLSHYFGFLERERVDWRNVDNDVLRNFRTSALEDVRSNKRARGELSAKRTVNLKLRCVYQFYAWAQGVELVSNLIGPSAPVRSSLTALAEGRVRIRRRSMARLCYPLCFRRVGDGARSRPRGYRATVEDVEAIRSEFFEHEPMVARRNALMLDIGDLVGLRIESIVSLLASQFVISRMHRVDSENFEVVPPKQKFGGRHAFTLSYELALEIERYVRTDRKKILEACGVDERVAKDALFLSTKSGRPLSRTTALKIFTNAFRRLGAPRGAGAHSLRRKHARAVVDLEIDARLQARQPIVISEITRAVSMGLGHDSEEAQAVYIESRSSKLRESYAGGITKERDLLRSEINQVRGELSEARARLARLERADKGLSRKGRRAR